MSKHADFERLRFLIRVVQKELKHLKYSQSQVFDLPFTPARAALLEHDPVLAEKVEAFTSRFCRLQDTLGDKLLPAWLRLLGERLGSVIDNLDKAEKLGVLPSADDWLEYRQLRNQMVHDYIEDMTILAQALQAANEKVAFFEVLIDSLLADIQGRGWNCIKGSANLI